MNKIKSVKSTFKNDTWIRSFLNDNKPLLILVIFLGFMTAFCASALMFISGYLITKASTKPYNILLIYVPIVLTRAFGIARPVFRYAQRLTSHNWVLKMTSKLRLKLYRTIESTGIFFRDNFKSGDILSILTEDVGYIQNLYLRSLFPSFVALAVYIFIIVATGVINIYFGISLFIIFAILMFIGPVMSLVLNGNRISDRKIYRKNLYTKITDSILGLGDYYVSEKKEDFYNNIVDEKNRLAGLEKDMREFSRRRNLIIQIIFSLVAVSSIIFSGIYFKDFSNKNWIAAFILCVFPLSDTFLPLSGGIEEMASHSTSIENVNNLSKYGGRRRYKNLEKDISFYFDESNTAISVENLYFDYKGMKSIKDSDTFNSYYRNTDSGDLSQKKNSMKSLSQDCIKNKDINHISLSEDDELIRDISFSIKKGEKVCVLGKSGTGKSTLLKIIRGDISGYSGKIKIFGQDMSDVDLGKEKVVGVLNQSPWIFNTSIFNNLKLGNHNLTYERASEIIKIVGLKEKIDSLENGLDTVVEEGGGNFSGGEKQRLALSRILAMDTLIILLDEPTVGLDPVTEHEILDTIFKAFENKTILWVTHHLQDIEKMDRVIYLSNGKIIMNDSPENLLKNNEFFKMLYSIDKGL